MLGCCHRRGRGRTTTGPTKPDKRDRPLTRQRRRTPTIDSNANQPQPTPLALLSVEDSSDDVELIRRQLSHHGFLPEVRQVQTRAEMERALLERHWGVICMDYALPSFDALGALAMRTDLAPDTPVIIVSGHIGETAAVSLLKAGADDYIPKHNLARLAPALRRAIRDAGERRARRQAEDERAHLVTELAHALEIRDEFLLLASHELRTPLTALRLNLERANRACPANDQARDMLGRADAQVDRISRLVGDMIAVSKLQPSEPLSPAETDAGPMLGELVAAFSEEQRINEIVSHLPSERLVGLWDRPKIEDALRRLLANAIKFGPGQPVVVRLERLGTLARFSVADRGIGIAREDQARIFGRFERAGPVRNYGGLGLGLWIARAIFEAHSGSLTVTSELGKGAIFIVNLPLAPTSM
jgi:signal transduction histidine kinase